LWLDDAVNARFSIPEEAVNKPGFNPTMRNDMNGMTVDTKDAFSFKFTDNKNYSNVLLDTIGGNFLMMDKYMQLDLNLPSKRIYGLGERNRNFTLEEGTWTMWANGQETPFDDGTGGKQTYGVHPFALVQTAIPGEFFGIFFRNANA
jgi:alpha-glucosidase (family GH31 glycosyl hydrolase)